MVYFFCPALLFPGSGGRGKKQGRASIQFDWDRKESSVEEKKKKKGKKKEKLS